ncbi:MAG: PQQ-binding-like beta-propeller repeat protein [Planctomycetota bacterium]
MSLSRCLLLLTLTAATALPGCVSRKKTSDPTPPGAEYRTGLALEPGYARDMGFSNRWARSVVLGKGQSVYAVVPLGDLLVIVERPDNVVTALNISDGSLAWKKVLGETLEDLYTPVGDADNIYVNSGRRLFTLSRRDGEIDKVANLAYAVESGPKLIDQLAIFGSGNGRVFAHHVFDGYKKWVYGLNNSIETSPLAENNQLFVADTDGNYAMLASSSGELRWQGRAFGPITANPVLDRAFVVLASEDQSLYSFVATTGRERWTRFRSEVPLTETPSVIDDTIYLPEPGIGLTAIDANTGQARWTIPDIRIPLVPHDGGVLVHDKTALTLIDPATGETLQTVPTQKLEMVVKGPSDSLIIVSQEGEVLRLDPQ